MPGSNGHRRDDGYMRDLRPAKPCCHRISKSAWCCLEDGHTGEHFGIDRGPVEKTTYDKGKQNG